MNAPPSIVVGSPFPLGHPIPRDPSDPASVSSSSVEPAWESAAQARELAFLVVNLALPLEGALLDEVTLVNSPVLPYARMVASLIERRQISRDELITALRKRMRQHSIGRRPRREYVLSYLNQHPP